MLQEARESPEAQGSPKEAQPPSQFVNPELQREHPGQELENEMHYSEAREKGLPDPLPKNAAHCFEAPGAVSTAKLPRVGGTNIAMGSLKPTVTGANKVFF